jgi:hypothetical protein
MPRAEVWWAWSRRDSLRSLPEFLRQPEDRRISSIGRVGEVPGPVLVGTKNISATTLTASVVLLGKHRAKR